MKSSSYYSRKAEHCRDIGRWAAAAEWSVMAKKARAVEKKRRSARPNTLSHHE